MSDFRKCFGIGCGVRETCRRYRVEFGEFHAWGAFFLSDSFKPETGCEFYWPAPGIEGRIVADFDKARE